MSAISSESVVIAIGGGAEIDADLHVPRRARGLVVFAHGSGSSRFSSRNRAVAEFLHARGLGTLLLDLLTRDEEAVDIHTRQYRFDIDRLAARVIIATDWIGRRDDVMALPIGYFGASTGAAAALTAASERPAVVVRAVVSRGGRPDLAGASLRAVTAPTLLIVGGDDEPVIELNTEARLQMHAAHVELSIVPGATHLFEEPGTLEEVQRLATEWFERYLISEETGGSGKGRGL